MRKSIIIITAILVSVTVYAQQLPFSSQYYTNMFVTNPAFTGNHENTNAFLSQRSQWIGIAGNPQTSYLTIDGPIEAKNIGLGLKLYSDNTDLTSRMGAFANYSYKLKINNDNNLYFGLAAGVLNNRIDFSKAVVRDANDPNLFGQSQSKTVFSADLGVAYTWKALEAGFCVPQLIGNKIKYKTNDGNNSYYNLTRYYQGSIKYTFDVLKDKGITAYPLIMVRGGKGAPVQYDVNAVVDWQKYGWFGITYHSNYAVATSIGLRYKNLALGYSYDFGITKIKSYLGSSSEFLLRYTFGGNNKAPLFDVGKDSLKDQQIADLQTKADVNKAQLDKLNAELEKIKARNLPTHQETPEHVENKENQAHTGSVDDYIDENNGTMYKGFYVIIGTFANVDNATKLKKANLLKGYTDTRIYQNKITAAYSVFVFKSDTKEAAVIELGKYKAEYPNVWIQKLE